MNARYIVTLLVALSFGIAGVAGFNWFMDPFDLFDRPHISGVNTVKRTQYYERIFRPLRVTQIAPASIVLGSSRTAAFTADKVAGYLADPFYNMSVSALRVREAVGYLRFLLHNADVRHVVLGVDFFAFNRARTVEPGFQQEMLEQNSRINLLMHSLLSITATKEAIASLRLSRAGIPTSSESDRFAGFDVMAGFELQLTQYLGERKFYRDFVFDDEAVVLLQNVVEEYRQAGRTIEILIPPSHALDCEAIRLAGLWGDFEKWKRGLAALATQTGAPVWDFAGYNVITTESLGPDMKNYSDSSHFVPAIAPLILGCMRGSADCPPGFARRLEIKSVEEHLVAVRAAGKAYRETDTVAMAFLADMAAKVKGTVR